VEGIISEDLVGVEEINSLQDSLFCVHLQRQYSAFRELNAFLEGYNMDKTKISDEGELKYYEALEVEFWSFGPVTSFIYIFACLLEGKKQRKFSKRCVFEEKTWSSCTFRRFYSTFPHEIKKISTSLARQISERGKGEYSCFTRREWQLLFLDSTMSTI